MVRIFYSIHIIGLVDDGNFFMQILHLLVATLERLHLRSLALVVVALLQHMSLS